MVILEPISKNMLRTPSYIQIPVLWNLISDLISFSYCNQNDIDSPLQNDCLEQACQTESGEPHASHGNFQEFFLVKFMNIFFKSKFCFYLCAVHFNAVAMCSLKYYNWLWLITCLYLHILKFKLIVGRIELLGWLGLRE